MRLRYDVDINDISACLFVLQLPVNFHEQNDYSHKRNNCWQLFFYFIYAAKRNGILLYCDYRQ